MEEKVIKIAASAIFVSIFVAICAIGFYVYLEINNSNRCQEYYRGNTSVIKNAILEGDLSINTGCSFPFIAYSTKIGDTDMVKWLIEQEADVNKMFTYKSPKTAPYKIRHTPIYYAINAELEARKTDWKSPVTPEFVTCLELLINAGADLETPCGKFDKDNQPLETQTTKQLIEELDHPLLNGLIEKYQ